MLLFFLACYLCIYVYVFNKILFYNFLKLNQDKFGFFYKTRHTNISSLNSGFFLYFYSFFNIVIYFYILMYNFLIEFNYNFIILDFSVIYYLLIIFLFLNSLLFNFYKIYVSQFYNFNYLWLYFIICIFTFFIFYNNNFCLICLFCLLFFFEFLSIFISGRVIASKKFRNLFMFNIKK